MHPWLGCPHPRAGTTAGWCDRHVTRGQSQASAHVLALLARRDVLAGLLFVGVALLGLWLSRDYPIGTALRMGTGYVPRLLCWILLGLGTIILVQGLRAAQTERPLSSADMSAWRPVIFVTASLVIFGLSIEHLGLVLSILLLIGVGAVAARECGRSRLSWRRWC